MTSAWVGLYVFLVQCFPTTVPQNIVMGSARKGGLNK